MTQAMIGTRRVIISRKLTAIASAMWRSSDPMPGYAPGVSMSVMIGKLELFPETHNAQRFAIAFGVSATEIAFHVFFCVPAFLLGDDDAVLGAEFGQTARHRLVIAENAVAVQFRPFSETAPM